MNKVLRLPTSLAPSLEKKLQKLGFEKQNNPNVLFAYKGNNLSVVFYPTGTLLVQGKGDMDGLLEELISGLNLLGGYIGTDEAGKGDLFGPLVVCGFAVETPKDAEEILKLGVKDSKDLSESAIKEIAEKLKAFGKHRCILIKPEVYNKLYKKFQNLNKLLSFAHANVIDGLYLETALELAITDRFMKGSFIDCYLNAPVELREEVGAEKYIGVAAASILARYLYLEELRRLSKEAGIELKSGSGEDAKRAFRELRAKLERERLAKFAKLHFKV